VKERSLVIAENAIGINHQRDVINSKYVPVSLAYFDMLGFSEFLKQKCSDSPQEMMQIFYELLLSLEREFHISSTNQLKFKVISDGFMIWFESQADEYFARLIQITYFAKRYLNRYNFLVRGGIVKGDHYVLDDVIVSPALVKAAILEKSAKVPKIKIEFEEARKLKEKVIHNYNNLGQEGVFIPELGKFLRFEREYLVEDGPQDFILHPVHGVELQGYLRENQIDQIPNCVALFKNYRDFLNANWNENLNSSSAVKEKFHYIIGQLNLYIDQNSAHLPADWKITLRPTMAERLKLLMKHFLASLFKCHNR
jgi:hypothetical protein